MHGRDTCQVLKICVGVILGKDKCVCGHRLGVGVVFQVHKCVGVALPSKCKICVGVALSYKCKKYTCMWHSGNAGEMRGCGTW